MDIVQCTCALLDMYCNHNVMLNSSMPSLLHCTSQHCASGFDRVAAVQRSRQQPDVKEDMTLLKTPELKFAAKSKFTTLMNINMAWLKGGGSPLPIVGLGYWGTKKERQKGKQETLLHNSQTPTHPFLVKLTFPESANSTGRRCFLFCRSSFVTVASKTILASARRNDITAVRKISNRLTFILFLLPFS